MQAGLDNVWRGGCGDEAEAELAALPPPRTASLEWVNLKLEQADNAGAPSDFCPLNRDHVFFQATDSLPPKIFFSGRCWAEAFYYKQMGKIFQLPIIQSNKEACSLI